MTEQLPYFRLHGTRMDIGKQRGDLIQNLPLSPVDDDGLKYAIRCRELAEHHHPAMVDEWEGMAQASGLNRDRFLAHYFATKRGLVGCTNIAATPPATADGTVWVGRNYDWAYADMRWCQARAICPEGEPRRLGLSHHWAGSPDVITDRGVVVLIAALPAVNTVEPGVQWHILVDMVATRANSVVEAVDTLMAVPHLRAMHYLIADKSSAAVVEGVPGGLAVRYPTDGIMVATNHLRDTTSDNARSEASTMRYRGATDMLEKRSGSIGEDEIRAVLCDHDHHICAGAHDGREGRAELMGRSGTIWSAIFRPHLKQMQASFGHPCQNQFQTVPWPDD
ncbi:MAG: C45 family autoproteolytic acyltransferase/hydrolase [Candidatus Latescibacteria bacterium]|nr:C45 family autoproteolytic acyltransferase/hydrolase [Candidatus Latescibacterota bacterium]